MSCNCHSKCKLLGGLEQQIMDILWSSTAPLRPSQVLRQLHGDHAYTTVMTVLKRMFDKNLVARQKIGNAFLYSAIEDKATYACSCLDDLFERLFTSYGSYVTDSLNRVARRLKI